MKFVILSLFAGFLAGLESHAAPLYFHTSAKQVSLVELYTSEGCSSCPPAETWLARQTNSPGLWQNFVPVAFHVDYWNYLGWADRWSDASYSLRQSEYAKLWHSENIYTPCFVVNGREGGSTFFPHSQPATSGRDAGLLSVHSLDSNHWDVVFAPVNFLAGAYEVHAALLAGGIRSEITAGENSGRTLDHEFVVLDLIRVGLKNEGTVVKGKFIQNPKPHSAKTLAIAVWITPGGELMPLQATGGWIVPPPASLN
jgi:hypothetical protein